LDKAARPILDFVDDLSTWYLRRSRERIKEGDIASSRFLSSALWELSKLIAPFMPFLAEEIYQKIKAEKKESVHLESWPEYSSSDFIYNEKIIELMSETRRIVSLALEKRNAVGIKVRQPLSKLKVKSEKLKGKEEYLELIKEEINVKAVEFDGNLNDEVELDTEITAELKREGEVREAVRAIQAARKEANLTPDQKIKIKFIAAPETIELIKSSQEEISKPTNVESIDLEIGDWRVEIM
jgi:isoleucyl-tRNA synthetase